MPPEDVEKTQIWREVNRLYDQAERLGQLAEKLLSKTKAIRLERVEKEVNSAGQTPMPPLCELAEKIWNTKEKIFGHNDTLEKILQELQI